jgi:DNA-binding NarL/FixJ family response regulator
MESDLRVLIIDDHPLFCDGLSHLLTRIDPAVTVRAVTSVDEAERLANQPFNLVLMDLQMPGTSGMAALRRVRAVFEDSSVVVVSADESPDTIHEAIRHGAAGYVPKSTDPVVTIHALNLVIGHGTYLPPAALRRAGVPQQPASGNAAWSKTLSPRQLAVLRGLLQGKPNKLIARDIGIAEGTVKAHLWAVYQLLGVSSRTQAMYRAHELNLFGGAAKPEADTRVAEPVRQPL